MSETFRQPLEDSSEHRTGNVIRRAHRERQFEVTEKTPVDRYIEKYGDPRRESKKERGGVEETGRMFEQILGTPDISKINKTAVSEGIVYEVEGFGGTFLSLQDFSNGHWGDIDAGHLKRCFNLVKENQGSGNDPINPVKFFPQSLRKKIMERLGFDNDESERVRYFTSVRTPLDYTPDIGADAFFEIDGNTITIDVSEKDTKVAGTLHADVLISENDIFMINEINLVGEGEQEKLAEAAYEQQIDAVAQHICEIYENRRQKAA